MNIVKGTCWPDKLMYKETQNFQVRSVRLVSHECWLLATDMMHMPLIIVIVIVIWHEDYNVPTIYHHSKVGFNLFLTNSHMPISNHLHMRLTSQGQPKLKRSMHTP